MSTIKQHGSITGRIVSRGSLTGTIAKSVERIEPNIEALTVSANGEYTTPENVHGFNPVTVNVPLLYDEGYADGYKASQDSITLQEKLATENGEYSADEGFTALQKVVVAVPVKEEQEKTLEITKNGTFEVAADEGKVMSKVTANVSVAFEGDIGKPYIDTSKITDFTRFAISNRLNRCIEAIDTSNGKDFTEFLMNSSSLTSVPLFDTSNAVNVSFMFQNCTALREIPKIDTSKATNTQYLFSGCSYLQTIPKIDTSRSTNFNSFVKYCKELTTMPSLNTSNGVNFSHMFESCAKLTSIPLLDISNGSSFYGMFNGCIALETVSLTTAKSNLQTSTFQNCTALKNLTIGEGWAVNIYLHYSNNLTVESLHGMIENLADLTGQTAKTFQIGATNLAKLDDEHRAMLAAKNWAYS